VVSEISVHQLAERLRRGEPTFLLDVRQPWEHVTAVLPGSYNIQLDQLLDRAHEVAPPDGAMIVVYCHLGVRSLTGTTLLRHIGHENAFSLAGGIDAWSQEIDPSVPRY
jgi:adenylyltransferase/sulfurtransferase